ncbi:hypothetical protein DCAR_0414537 [Daucus carota subsp. sativus]|uniref:Uncharacterized protein n=1 Tax=Daucus carota subsp. sativus TaxID=79200 RepID=A0AAF0WTL4_DAUCS|nr:hypothetical protein DCAR_0414537 [Daucus carota subsp. sativus]
MERNNSYGNTWADQWESNPDDRSHYTSLQDNNKSAGSSKYGKKLEQGLGKTKAVASVGVKKVKQGSSLTFQWIKNKYTKTTQKH